MKKRKRPIIKQVIKTEENNNEISLLAAGEGDGSSDGSSGSEGDNNNQGTGDLGSGDGDNNNNEGGRPIPPMPPGTVVNPPKGDNNGGN